MERKFSELLGQTNRLPFCFLKLFSYYSVVELSLLVSFQQNIPLNNFLLKWDRMKSFHLNTSSNSVALHFALVKR